MTGAAYEISRGDYHSLPGYGVDEYPGFESMPVSFGSLESKPFTNSRTPPGSPQPNGLA